jgi:signal transduction histidine kinase/ligand-binding sensor domain-containing protein
LFQRWRQGLFFLAVFLGLTGLSFTVAAVDYLVDKWDTEEGLPSSTVTAIAQTPDGYIWVGTYNGLARFDGSRFVLFDPVNTPELTQARVKGLYLDASGTLWINTFRGGLTSYRNGEFRNEWPDQPTFDLQNTLVESTTNRVTFVMQFGEVLWRDGTGTNWHLVEPQPSSLRPIFQCRDADGRLWFLTREGHILRFAGGKFSLLPDDGGLSGSKIFTLESDAQGRVWAGAENEIALWNGGEFEAMTPTNSRADVMPRALFPMKSGDMWVLDGPRLRKMSGRSWVTEIVAWRGLLGPASGRAMGANEDAEGGLWFNHYGNGLFYIAPDGGYQRLTSATNNLPSDRHLPGDRVGAWFQSSDGGIWAGVDHGGVVRLRNRKFQVVGPAEGLPVRTALSVSGDTNGAVWIGTAGGGLCRWRDGRLETFPVGSSASANLVFSIARRPDGGLWLSASEGEDLYQFVDGKIQRVAWDVHGIKVALLDRQNRLWLGLKAGVAVSAGSLRQVWNTRNPGFLPAVRALAEAPDGTIWAGADDGTIYRCETNGLTEFRAQDALAGQAIYSLYADTNGVLWAGTFRGGLVRFKDGKFTRFTASQGLAAKGETINMISQIQEDSLGRLWLGTQQGLFCVHKDELQACADGDVNKVNLVAYGRHYGLPSQEFSDGYQPACWRAPDGRLWFTTARGVVFVKPEEVVQKSSPPPVVIEELHVDDQPVDVRSGKVIIPPGRKQLDIRFTALSFDAGDRSRFRYQLEGYDPGWVDAESLRMAHYAKLAPRDYRFRVIACNNEGVWNETGASLDITVEPFFYQTKSFSVLAGLLAVGVISFAVRRAVTRKYRRKLAAMEKQHAIERDRARIAKDIHDDIGAGLTQITLLTEFARRDPEQTGKNLDRINDSARRLTKAMDEIVWAVDPQHDTVAGLMDYASAYAEEFLRVADIRCRMDLPVNLPAAHVDAELRYNLFLAMKEALNNIVKHAHATEVWLRLKLEGRALTVVVEDNGQGIAAGGAERERFGSGSGLGNLGQRLESVGGHCQIRSESGRGTRVELTVFLTQPSPVVAIGGEPAI